MVFDNNNKFLVSTEAIIWLACMAIALGTYEAKIDIGFWPGLIVWGVFLLGVGYFILWVFVKIFG